MTKKDQLKLQREILKQIPSPPHGRLLLAPRVGKTKLVIDLIKREKPKSILWVTPSAKLAEETIPEEFKKWKAIRYLKKLKTTTYASLNKITDHHDLVVLDEEQHLTERNSENLIKKKNYSCVISMTGKQTKHREKKELYDQLNLKVLYELPITEAVEEGILANYTLKVLKIAPVQEKMKEYYQVQKMLETLYHRGRAKIIKEKPPGGNRLLITGKENVVNLNLVKRESKFGTGELYAAIDSVGRSYGYVVEEKDETISGKLTFDRVDYRITKGLFHKQYPKHLLLARARAIGSSELKTEVARNLLQKFSKDRILLFCNTIKQAEELCEYTYHSKTDNKDLEAFQKEEINHIAMVNAGGTGFNYRNLDHLILIQSDSDKNGLTTQKIARTLLQQKNYKATIWLLCIEKTQDEVWVSRALKSFNEPKIKYINAGKRNN